MPTPWRIIAVLAVLFSGLALGAWSAKCRRRFSYDSMVYVDVARHIGRGEGIVHSIGAAHASSLPRSFHLPEPLTAQPPLYPIGIAAVARLGLSEEDAALWLAAGGWLGVVLLGWRFTAAWTSPGGGALAALLLLALTPLRDAGASAWSETLALVLWFGAAVLAFPASSGRASLQRCFAAGILLSLAFVTRYSFWVGAPVFAASWLAGGRGRAGLAQAVSGLAGVSVPAGAWLLRNAAYGPWLGDPRAPSSVGISENLALALEVLFARWADERQGIALQAVLAIALLAVAVWAHRQASTRSPPLLLPWCAAYALALVVQASVLHFDPISGRLMLPATAALACWVGAVLGSVIHRPRVAYAALMLAAIAFSVQAVSRWARCRPRSADRVVASSDRLSWLKDHTGPSDLIIGQQTAELAFYLGRPSISILPAPGYRPPTHEGVLTLAHDACRSVRDVYLVLRRDREPLDAGIWGPFLADLEQHGAIPGIEEVQDTYDGRIFRIPCRGR